MTSTVMVLGTGGTLAGIGSSAADHTGYVAGQIEIGQLLAAVPSLSGQPLACEQVAQVDSKDMDFAIWQHLAQRVAWHLERPEVCGIVVTHGTDTLEETAYFLQRVLAPRKPVVLTAAMRPSTALQADGPQNLVDACGVARAEGVKGVVVVVAGAVFAARDVRKVHPYQLNAFDAGDAGPLAWVEEDRLRCLRPWPDDTALGLATLWPDPAHWPRVEIVTSHAGARGDMVEALCACGVQGLVAAATGNGTVHHALEQALLQAQANGVRVLRSTRCMRGSIVGTDSAGGLPSAGDLTPAKARIELLLQLMRDAAP